jgi:hypothetical protein
MADFHIENRLMSYRPYSYAIGVFTGIRPLKNLVMQCWDNCMKVVVALTVKPAKSG